RLSAIALPHNNAQADRVAVLAHCRSQPQGGRADKSKGWPPSESGDIRRWPPLADGWVSATRAPCPDLGKHPGYHYFSLPMWTRLRAVAACPLPLPVVPSLLACPGR